MTPFQNPLFNTQPSGDQPRNFDSSPANIPGSFVVHEVAPGSMQGTTGTSLRELTEIAPRTEQGEQQRRHEEAQVNAIREMGSCIADLRNYEISVHGVGDYEIAA